MKTFVTVLFVRTRKKLYLETNHNISFKRDVRFVLTSNKRSFFISKTCSLMNIVRKRYRLWYLISKLLIRSSANNSGRIICKNLEGSFDVLSEISAEVDNSLCISILVKNFYWSFIGSSLIGFHTYWAISSQISIFAKQQYALLLNGKREQEFAISEIVVACKIVLCLNGTVSMMYVFRD